MLAPPAERWLAQPRVQLAVVLSLAAVLFFSKLHGNGLPNYDDCYYAQKAREILQSGDWLTLTLNHEPRFDNPPLFMWLEAVSFLLFGVSEFSARLPSAVLGLATVALTYSWARRLSGPWAGFGSAFALTTTILFARYARRAMTDVTLTFLEVLALLALVLALEKDRRYFLLWGLAIALAVLTKSVLGLFPLFITGLYLLSTKRLSVLLDPWFLLGSLVMVLLGGSWYAHQYAHYGAEFLKVHFQWLIVERAAGLPSQPWTAHLSYFKELALNYWPWLPVLALGVADWARKTNRREDRRTLPLLWMATMLTALSLPQSRVVWYLLPVFPAAAIVCGQTLEVRLGERAKLNFVGAAAVLALLALAVIHATPLELSKPRETDVRALAPIVKQYGDHGARVIAFRQVYHQLNNALLFYSDHAAWPSYDNYAELAAAMRGPGLVLCVTSRTEAEGVTRNLPGVHVIRETEKLALLANQPLAAVRAPE